jgi:hypothetical protein
VIARNAGHALNFELVVAIQRALGLERRPVGAAVVATEPLRSGVQLSAPGLATV